jgi:hypothetical protein
MNSSKKVNDTEIGSRCLRLPKPDPANITVITPNLPNKPILPWTHFDSPWLESEGNQPEESQGEDLESSNSQPNTDEECP